MFLSKRKALLVLIFICLFLNITLGFTSNAQTEVRILCFIQNGFGESYYINKEIMETYDWTVVTASTSNFVIGCKNNDKNITDTYSDVLVQDITDENLTDYNCLFVPSGGHWSNVIAVSRILELLKLAHEDEILVAGICTGMIVLANADILENVDVAYNIHATSWMDFAGANMTGYPVVADQGIITGGFGGGIGYGPDGAPNEAFCEKIKEEIESQTNKTTSFLLFMIYPFLVFVVASIMKNKDK